MENNKQKLKDKYSIEINEIKYILENLNNERIFYPGKFTNDKSDGSLQQNIKKLSSKLNDLFNKIEYDKPSDSDQMDEIFNIKS
ncbi:MAG: hypothetical protein RR588_02110 [Solibacillus sp.]